VVPPTNVSDAKTLGIYEQLYANCINLYKPSWCLTQVNNATSSFSAASLQAETTYNDAKAKDEATIQQGQATGGLLGQQMISDGNSVLANDQTTYITAYNAAYNVYSNAILLSNQQGACGNSIPTYQAPAY